LLLVESSDLLLKYCAKEDVILFGWKLSRVIGSELNQGNEGFSVQFQTSEDFPRII